MNTINPTTTEHAATNAARRRAGVKPQQLDREQLAQEYEQKIIDGNEGYPLLRDFDVARWLKVHCHTFQNCVNSVVRRRNNPQWQFLSNERVRVGRRAYTPARAVARVLAGVWQQNEETKGRSEGQDITRS